MRNTCALKTWHHMLDDGNFFNNDLEDKVFRAFLKHRVYNEHMGIQYSLESKTL